MGLVSIIRIGLLRVLDIYALIAVGVGNPNCVIRAPVTRPALAQVCMRLLMNSIVVVLG